MAIYRANWHTKVPLASRLPQCGRHLLHISGPCRILAFLSAPLLLYPNPLQLMGFCLPAPQAPYNPASLPSFLPTLFLFIFHSLPFSLSLSFAPASPLARSSLLAMFGLPYFFLLAVGSSRLLYLFSHSYDKNLPLNHTMVQSHHQCLRPSSLCGPRLLPPASLLEGKLGSIIITDVF